LSSRAKVIRVIDASIRAIKDPSALQGSSIGRVLELCLLHEDIVQIDREGADAKQYNEHDWQ
jgi:hypothetical protein